MCEISRTQLKFDEGVCFLVVYTTYRLSLQFLQDIEGQNVALSGIQWNLSGF